MIAFQVQFTHIKHKSNLKQVLILIRSLSSTFWVKVMGLGHTLPRQSGTGLMGLGAEETFSQLELFTVDEISSRKLKYPCANWNSFFALTSSAIISNTLTEQSWSAALFSLILSVFIFVMIYVWKTKKQNQFVHRQHCTWKSRYNEIISYSWDSKAFGPHLAVWHSHRNSSSGHFETTLQMQKRISTATSVTRSTFSFSAEFYLKLQQEWPRNDPNSSYQGDSSSHN